MTPLYEDNALLTFDKPAGLLVVPGRGADKKGCLLSVSLQSVTFDLSIGTTDAFIMSPRSRPYRSHASASSICSSTGILKIPAEAACSSKSKVMYSVLWRIASSAA